MKKFLRQHLFTVIGLAGGAIVGYFYWKWICCNNGSCAITSKPLHSMAYGSVMGALLLSVFKKGKPPEKKQ